MAGTRGASFSIVAMTAMLLSAGGIAYMASVSYPDELGIVDARLAQHQESAAKIAERIRARLSTSLEQITQAPLEELSDARRSLAVFVINAEGDLLLPSTEPLRRKAEDGLEGLLPMRGFQARQRQLARAQTMERGACPLAVQPCEVSFSQRRAAAALYESVMAFPDTGAEALLGLARLNRVEGKGDLAAGRYQELAERFDGHADAHGVPYRLLADIGNSEVSQLAPSSLNLLRKILAQEYDAPNALLEVAAQSAIETLEKLELGQAQQQELQALRKALSAARADTLVATRLQSRLSELRRSAGAEPKSMTAPWATHKSLLYVAAADARIYGMILSEPQLQEMALQAATAVGLHAALVPRIQGINDGAARDSDRRAQASLSPLLPQLALVLWDQGKGDTAMADIAEARRRHRGITGGLVAILVLGLFATVRGAARERELARLKSDFVSTVSHELKTPLTSIRMFAEMLKEGVAGADRAKEAHYQHIIVKESERLGLLIASMLDYAQIEKGTRNYADTSETFSALVRESVETFMRLREGQGQEISIDIEAAAEPLQVRVDREVIVQCLLNLLSNAAKYGGEEQIRVSVHALDAQRCVEVRVRDQGPGVASSEQDKIFREFYRTPDAIKSAIEGTGLGLALVKRHVEALGGSVALDSTPGKGATFTIRLATVDARS